MRTVGTLVVGLLFLVVFNGAFLLHAVGGYPLDADAVGATVRSVDAYEAFMDAVDEALLESDANDLAPPGFADDFRRSIEEHMSEAWFYDTFEAAYGDFVAYLEGERDEVEIDLSDPREGIESFLDEVAEGYGRGAPEARAELGRRLGELPASITLSELLDRSDEGRGEEKLEELRDLVGTFEVVRGVLFAIALVLLGLVGVIAAPSRKRLATSLGAVLFVSSFVYLASATVAAPALWAAVEPELDVDTATKAETLGRELAGDLVEAGLHDAFVRAHLPVGGLALIGLVLFGVGLAAKAPGTSPRPPPPPTPPAPHEPHGPEPGPGVWQPAQSPD